VGRIKKICLYWKDSNEFSVSSVKSGGRWKKLIWLVARVEFWKWQAGQKQEERTFFSQWEKFIKRLTSRKIKRKAILNGFLYFLIIQREY
jgi:hypothetical protein